MGKLGGVEVALPILKYLLEGPNSVSDYYWNNLISTHFGSPLNVFYSFCPVCTTSSRLSCKKGVMWSYFVFFVILTQLAFVLKHDLYMLNTYPVC